MRLIHSLYRQAWRALFFGWRNVCRVATILRHPHLAGRPALLLRYETPAQESAYIGTNLTPTLNLSRTRRVLVIVPFRDKWVLTEQALESLLRQQLQGIEVLVAMVDNGSAEPNTLAGIADFQRREVAHLRFRHLRYEIPFNYSRLNNLAVVDCADFAPDHLLLLNNDVILTDLHTLSQMCAFLEANPSCGSVGCTLLYPSGYLQHLYIDIGCVIVGAHPFRGKRHRPNDPWFQSPRPVGAATAALLMLPAAVFRAMSGFDEQLSHSFQDIDLALKLQAAGYVNWVLPLLPAIHHETQSRPKAFDWTEVDLVTSRWGRCLTANPYTSPRFSRWSETPAISLGEGVLPWHHLR